jgi:hypothetical protein
MLHRVCFLIPNLLKINDITVRLDFWVDLLLDYLRSQYAWLGYPTRLFVTIDSQLE